MISRTPVSALLGLLCGTALFLAVQFGSTDLVDAAAPATPARTLAPVPTAAIKPAPLPRSEDLADEILARPLFSASRQPPDAEPEAVETAAAVPEAPKPPGRLAGVSIRPEAREALFERDGEKPVTVKLGQDIGGWKLTKIEPDHVVLKNGRDEQIVKPSNGTRTFRPRVVTPADLVPRPGAPAQPKSVAPPATPVPGARPPRQPRNPNRAAGLVGK